MIIFRYLTKEVSAALIAISLILLTIFMSNQLVRYLSYVADGRLEIISIVKLMGLEIPHLLGLLLPLALYLAILLAYGRLYIDQEMTILGSCGVGQWRIIKMTLPISLSVMVVVAVLNLWLNPKILNIRNHLLEQASAATTLKTMLPGRFQEFSGGKWIAYAGRISADRQQLADLFIAQQRIANQQTYWDIIAAGKGYQLYDKQSKQQYIVTTNSYRYIGAPGEKNFKIIRYGRYGVAVQNKPAVVLADEDALPTTLLLKAASKYPRYAAEIQWRFSLPIMVLILVLVAVPLCRVKRGQGKYARFLPAILLYIIYANMLIVGRTWVSKEIVPGYLGIWWIHLVVLLGIISYFSFGTIIRRIKQTQLKRV